MKTQSRFGVTIADQPLVTVNDSNTIDFTASGTSNQTITADVIIDPAVDNITVATVGGVYTKLIDEVTYAELAALISGSDLIQGRQYLITDYRTVHTIPNTVDTNTGTLEPLIVTALSTTDLEPVAYSTTHKDDIVYYDPVNNSKVNGSTKGCIYRRIDTVNNSDIPFDWREVKFRRWQIDVDTVFDIGDTYAVGDVVLDANNTTIWISLVAGNIGNTPVDTDGYWRKFEWDNLAYVSYSSVSMILCTGGAAEFTIPVTANYQDIKSITSAKDVRMYYERVTLLDILESNNSCFSTINESIIKISGDMRNNHINGIYDSDINAQTFSNNSVLFFTRNIIKSVFRDNSIYVLNDNTILFSFSYNSLRMYDYNYNRGFFQSNRQGSGYSNAVSENIFNASFNSNHLDKIAGATFRYNEFHKIATVTGYSFLTATHVFGNYTKEIIERSNGTPILRYTDNTNTILYVAVDA